MHLENSQKIPIFFLFVFFFHSPRLRIQKTPRNQIIMNYVPTSINYDSDDGSYPIYDPENWATFVLRFGKYKGETLGEMISKGKKRSYLRYILGWEHLRPNTEQNIKRALLEYKKMKENRIFIYIAMKRRTFAKVHQNVLPAEALDLISRGERSRACLQAPAWTVAWL